MEQKAMAKKDAAAKEIREGATYKSNISLESHDTDWIEEIPAPLQPPKVEVLPAALYEEIIFDLETTGLGICFFSMNRPYCIQK